MKYYAHILLVTTSALVGGCAVGPDFKRPVPPAVTRYVGGAAKDDTVQPGGQVQHILLGQEIEGNWWKLFRSDRLDDIVREAVANNQTLAAAAATLAQAQELVRAQSGTQYPQVGLSAGVGRQKYGDEFLGGFFNLPPFTYYAIGPTVSYTLDYTGGIARTVEQRRALAEVKQHQLEAAYLTVTGQAVMQALNIASIQAQITTLQTILDQDRDNLKLIQTALDAGSVARIDVVSAQSQIAKDMAQLPPLRQELALAHHALAVIIGAPPANELPAEIDLGQIALPLELPVRLPSELAHHRPDVLAAEAQLHAATSAVGVAESNLYPKIQLSATLGQQAVSAAQLFDSADTAWSLISGLTAPLFDGGTLRAEKRAAVDAMHAAAATYQQTVLEAFAQVADMLEALNHDGEELDAQDQAQQAAQSNLELARASYSEGNTGVLQVLDAQRSYQQARLGYVKAVGQRYLDTVQLFLALGGTSPDSTPMAPSSVQEKSTTAAPRADQW